MKKTALVLALLLFVPVSAQASPWAEKQGYFPKVGGKLVFGLNNSLLGWTNMFMEAHQEEKYETQWEGFCVGMGRSVVYTAAGLVQLVTFPIPVDFPDVGQGLHVLKPEPKTGKEGDAVAKQDKSAWSQTEEKSAAAAEPVPAETQNEPAPKSQETAAPVLPEAKPAAAEQAAAAAAQTEEMSLEERLKEIEKAFTQETSGSPVDAQVAPGQGDEEEGHQDDAGESFEY